MLLLDSLFLSLCRPGHHLTAMKVTTIIFSLLIVSVSADEKPSQIVGRGRSLADDDIDGALSMAKLASSARLINGTSKRRLSSTLDKVCTAGSMILLFGFDLVSDDICFNIVDGCLNQECRLPSMHGSSSSPVDSCP